MAQLVFISHASLDKTIADRVCKFLEERGIACWIAPRDVPPGAKYGEEIVNAIEAAAAMVLLFSEHMNDSEQAMNEVERAVSLKTPIFPLKIGPGTPSRELEYFVSRPQWLNATTASLDVVLAQLVDAVAPLVIAPATPSPDSTSGLPQTIIRVEDTRHRVPSPNVFEKKRLIVGTGIFLFLFLVASVTTVFLRRPTPAVPSLSLAYQALEHKDWPQAETLFQRLVGQTEPPLQSQGYTGLSAVAFARGDVQQALDFATQAETLDPEIVYSHVIRGHILWDQGKIEAARVAYRTAADKTNGLPWQQAIASNRLGRIYAAQGFTGTALKYYDRAISQRQDMAVAYANKAHLLAQLDKPQEAIRLYRQALQIDPDDRMTLALLRQTEQRQQLAQDDMQQERLAQQVAVLLQAHKEGRPPKSANDNWTSTPLTLAFLGFQHQVPLTTRAGEEEFLRYSLVQALQESGRLLIIDQALFDMLLVELQRSASELADPQFALQVSSILAARLIAMGNLVRSGTETKLSVSLLETATGAIRAQADAAWTPSTLGSAVAQISYALLQQVRQAYPLRGCLTDISPQGILLNIGSNHGVTPGLTMQVFRSEEPSEINSPMGLIEVTVVEDQRSQAKVLHHAAVLQEDWKVQEAQKP